MSLSILLCKQYCIKRASRYCIRNLKLSDEQKYYELLSVYIHDIFHSCIRINKRLEIPSYDIVFVITHGFLYLYSLRNPTIMHRAVKCHKLHQHFVVLV